MTSNQKKSAAMRARWADPQFAQAMAMLTRDQPKTFRPKPCAVCGFEFTPTGGNCKACEACRIPRKVPCNGWYQTYNPAARAARYQKLKQDPVALEEHRRLSREAVQRRRERAAQEVG